MLLSNSLPTLFKSLALVAALALPSLAAADGRSIIVLDGSGSMWGQIDGRPKLEIARDALAEVLKSIPADTELGLMAYGHREKGSCSDIELIVPPAKGTAKQIEAAAAKMQFLGKTPLTEAVRQAAADLRSTEEKATVILITDGIETCAADPCALGLELEKSGVDFTAHVVGFGLTADEGKQVACLAENTGGKYIVADDLASLTQALETTMVSAPEPEPVAPAPPAALEYNFIPTVVMAPGVPKPDDSTDISWELHSKNADGSTGDRIWTEYNAMKAKVDPGDYRLVTQMGTVTVESDVSFTADALTAPEINMNAARIIVHPIGVEGGPVLDGAAVQLTAAGGINTTQYGDSRFYVSAGEITLTGSIGSAEIAETQTLAAGDDVERNLLIGSGVAAIEGYYVDGMLMEDGAHLVQVLSAQKKIDGSQTSFGTTYGAGGKVALPPGDYIAVVSQNWANGETPFTVKIGERTDVKVILNAGVINVKAPGATSIEIFNAKTDINGNRKSLDFDYGEEINRTGTAGDVIAVAKWGEISAEKTVTIKAGERVEVTLTKP